MISPRRENNRNDPRSNLGGADSVEVGTTLKLIFVSGSRKRVRRLGLRCELVLGDVSVMMKDRIEGSVMRIVSQRTGTAVHKIQRVHHQRTQRSAKTCGNLVATNQFNHENLIDTQCKMTTE